MSQQEKDQKLVRMAKRVFRDFQEGRLDYDLAEWDLCYFGTICHGRRRKHRIYRMLRALDRPA